MPLVLSLIDSATIPLSLQTSFLNIHHPIARSALSTSTSITHSLCSRMLRYHLAAITGLFTSQVIAGGLNVPLPENNVFDYVVVGGGPAGLTVANRLSENANVQVLLLESGEADNYPESIMIPYYQGAAGSVDGKCGGFNWYEI